MELSAVSPTALRHVDELLGHELEAGWLMSSRSGTKDDQPSAKSLLFI